MLYIRYAPYIPRTWSAPASHIHIKETPVLSGQGVELIAFKCFTGDAHTLKCRPPSNSGSDMGQGAAPCRHIKRRGLATEELAIIIILKPDGHLIRHILAITIVNICHYSFLSGRRLPGAFVLSAAPGYRPRSTGTFPERRGGLPLCSRSSCRPEARKKNPDH
jgi:hypothetical protein